MEAFCLDTLPSVAFNNLKALPDIHAVYFAVARWGEILYIGQAHHLRSRLVSHNLSAQLDYLGCSNIYYIKFDKEAIGVRGVMRQIEKYFIKKFKPLLNNMWVKPPKKSPHLETA